MNEQTQSEDAIALSDMKTRIPKKKIKTWR